MRSKSRIAFGLLCLSAVSTTGCDSLSALTKLGDCSASFLTASDIVGLNASVKDLMAQQDPPTVIPTLSESQAQALADFLEANDANCVAEIQAVIEKADSDPNSVQGLDELAAAFEDSDDAFDPENVTADDLENILANIVSGD